ncbi:PREDICTED: putative malate transporter YflS [Trachymyrmex cornetzi]|uniref:putative malate transporter YflS n=1 Tax=Trachymyrmex cornetzi TaxID=471704 RepID=UPI00084F803C|nr:PREDICTED: putative malate transporter YflS [Trachymyrmex cornetzi]
MSVRETLQGFGEDIVWLVVFAFFISRAIIKSNLSKRIAYFLISKLGSSTIGLSYSLILTELLIAPVIPSATARGGAIIFPIARAISDQYSCDTKNVSNPELIKQFLMKICFQSNVITSAMFLTAMFGNPFIAKLARGVGVELDWITWAKAAFIPGLLSLILLPFIIMYVIKPHIGSCNEAIKSAKHALKEMGKISTGEIVVLCTFVLLLGLWMFGYNIGINSTATALLDCVILVLCGVITLDDIIQEKGAWDTFIWFGIFVTLSSALSGSGVMGRITEEIRDIIVQKLDADKAEEIHVIDLKGKTDIALYMIIASELSMRHVKSLADNLSQELKNHISDDFNIEGLNTGKWVLIDVKDVIVHIFQPEIRSQYDIDKLWNND